MSSQDPQPTASAATPAEDPGILQGGYLTALVVTSGVAALGLILAIVAFILYSGREDLSHDNDGEHGEQTLQAGHGVQISDDGTISFEAIAGRTVLGNPSAYAQPPVEVGPYPQNSILLGMGGEHVPVGNEGDVLVAAAGRPVWQPLSIVNPAYPVVIALERIVSPGPRFLPLLNNEGNVLMSCSIVNSEVANPLAVFEMQMRLEYKSPFPPVNYVEGVTIFLADVLPTGRTLVAPGQIRIGMLAGHYGGDGNLFPLQTCNILYSTSQSVQVVIGLPTASPISTETRSLMLYGSFSVFLQ